MKLFERLIYWFIWSGSCFYSLYCFSKHSLSALPFLYSEDFQEGWKILDKKQDISDSEWTFFKNALHMSWFWILGQIVITQLFMKKWSEYLSVFYAIYSSVFFLLFMGIIPTLIYMSFVCLAYIIHKLSNHILCFVIAVFVLCATSHPYYIHTKNNFMEDDTKSFFFDIGLGWLMARCISFSIDKINKKTLKFSFEDITEVFAYCFYLPVFFTGPLMNYNVFRKQILAPRTSWTYSKIYSIIIQLLRYIFAYIIVEFLLHFLYSSAMQFYPGFLYGLNSWTLCGLGYSLPVLFYLKYVVIYGLAGLFAQVEQFNFPPPPKCISRIHLSSYQWRYFDRGLHLWLSEYIYYPIVGLGKKKIIFKVFGCFLCFAFVCIWHGMGKSICIWSILSFLGVILEKFSYQISSKIFQKIEVTNPLVYKFIRAFFGTFAFMLMCISCMFFLSNYEVGMYFVNKIIFGYPVPFIPTFIIMFCGCQVSIDVQNWEETKIKQSKNIL